MPPKGKKKAAPTESSTIRKRQSTRIMDIRERAAPITKCPPEILSKIFEYYLGGESRPVRRLLLVCRRWYNAAISTPQLWTRIDFAIHSTDMVENIRTLKLFISACLKNTGSLMLDIEADLTCLMSRETWLRKVPPQDNDSDDDGLIDFDNLEGYMDPTGVLEAFALLIGEAGESMERWRSLSLHLPGYPPLAIRAWKMLIGRTPNLASLTIKYSSYRDQGKIGFGKEEESSFPDLSSLKSLTLQGKVNLHSLNPTSLRSLQVRVDLCDLDWIKLYHFKGLHTLSMGGGMSYWGDPIFASFTLSMPLLRDLQFENGFSHLNAITFDCPSLINLRFIPSHPRCFKTVPSLKPKTVEWRICGKENDWNHDNIQQDLKPILLQYPHMQRFAIPEFAESVFYTLFGNLRKETPSLFRLETVDIALKAGGTRTIEAASIQSQ